MDKDARTSTLAKRLRHVEPALFRGTFEEAPLTASLCQTGEALLLYEALGQLLPANESDLSIFRELLCPDGSDTSFLRLKEYRTWQEEHNQDLTSLAGPGTSEDAVTRLLNKFIASPYHEWIGRRVHKPIVVEAAWAGKGRSPPLHYYSDNYIAGAVTALVTILASLLPGLSALGLFFIKSQLIRMVAIVIFTLVFSIVISVVAKARRVDCFAATAAFSAVLCVFVGTSDQAQCC